MVIIHGIGEQKPMETLRSFVETTMRVDSAGLRRKDVRIWSNPDTITQNYDLRRITALESLPGDRQRRTDFFELYWAHHMEGTRLGAVWSWIIFDLALRDSATMPAPMRDAKRWILLVIALFVIATAIALSMLLFGLSTPLPVAISAWTGAIIFALANIMFVLPYAGDAARFFRMTPSNVKARAAILKEAVEVIDKLHEGDRYSRIVVVAHSLGTVVGYEALTRSFARRVRDKEFAVHEQIDGRDTVDEWREKDEAGLAGDISKLRDGQRKVSEFLADKGWWKITDFITLGSPLTYSHVLMAKGEADLRARQDLRELPVCPPLRDTSSNSRSRLLYKRMGRTELDGQAAFCISHAAIFAATRWTNIYFPVRRVVFGDVIGGPAAHLFGAGILDVPVGTTHLYGKGLFSHTSYWSQGGLAGTPDHISALRDALALGETESTQLDQELTLADLQEDDAAPH
ncbi:MAG: hypothetical protein ACRCWO_05795 [Bosea sp. (in: a-proteobacteria)]